ncbi:MAG: oxygenase MpaB family protein, partial [Chthoniobacterales bacterium]
MQLPTHRFSPNSSIWRVTSELVILLGGPLAAVLQAAHPEVAVAVTHHSKFKTDPTGRLHRTLEAVYTLVFGTKQDAEKMVADIGELHRPVHGQDPIPYNAFSQDAQMWVTATLIISAFDSYERFYQPLTEAAKTEHYKDMHRFGECFGLKADYGPQDWRSFREYFTEMLSGNFLGS